MISGAGIIVNRKKVWEVLNLELYKYQICTSGGSWQFKYSSVVRSEWERQKDRVCEIIHGKTIFIPDNLYYLLYWTDAQCVRRYMSWFIYCHSLPYFLCYNNKTQRLGPPWRCGKMQSISPICLPGAPKQSLEPHPANIYAQAELHVLWLISLTPCGFHCSTQNQTQTYVFLGSGPT